MHTKTKKANTFYTKESKQKYFFAKKIYISVDLHQRTKRRAWYTIVIITGFSYLLILSGQ